MVVACPTEERLAAFAAGACAGEERTSIGAHLDDCARCSSWLHEASADESWLTAVRGALAGEAPAPAAPAQGDVVAGFRLLREVGEGGMGVVYEAEQDSPRRRVALKLIRPGLASARMLRRFEHEAEVLGRLQHPGIAQIFAAGTFASGASRQPFFAMELVQGETLLEHARGQMLDVRARLHLFVAVCDAVQHAHQRGVVHRDLKPANILVTADHRPKVLDFGVARLLETDGGAGTLHTLPGQLVGTLAYMSPEQVAGAADLDERSDVYSLGVVLYELLSGRLPYRLKGEGIAERARAITDEPPVPLGAVARGLRGDLETIAGKAIEKVRERRYGSALELAQDVQRFLRAEPVLARPPSTTYQLRLFVRRRRGLVAAGLAVFLALAGGLIATMRQARRAEAQRIEAVAARDFLQEVLVQASPAERDGREFSMRRVLEIALARVDRHLMETPGAEAGVRHTLGRVQSGLGMYAEAREQLTRAAELYEHVARDDVQLVYALADLAVALERLGELDAAEAVVRKAFARAGTLDARHAFVLGHAASVLGIAHYTKGRLDQAENSFRAAVAAYGRVEEAGKRDVNVAEAKGLLALALQARGRAADAEPVFREAIAALRAGGARTFVLATNLGNFAGLLAGHGAHAEALALQEEALAIMVENFGEGSEHAASHRRAIGKLRFEQGERDEGLAIVRAALDSLRTKLGEHPRVVQALVELAGLEAQTGAVEQAEARLREALAMGSGKVGARHFLTNRARVALGRLLLGAGRAGEAVELLEQALAIAEEDHGSIPGVGAEAAGALGEALAAAGRCAEAERLLTPRVAAAGDAAEDRHALLVSLRAVYEAWGRAEDAERCARDLAAGQD